MFSIIFDIVKSEDHEHHYLFSDLTKDRTLNWHYQLFLIDAVIDWCKNQNMKFEVIEGAYPMMPVFKFEKAEEAIHFKTKWS